MISHHHKAIFVHIPKTGGQSIEWAFLDDLGLGWKDRDQIGLRRNPDRRSGPRQLAHLYASEYVALGHVTPDAWRDYTCFAVVRHPYDRIVSEFRYRLTTANRRGEPLPDDPFGAFDVFIRQNLDEDRSDQSRHLQTQTRFVVDDSGGIIVDHVLPFETLNRSLQPIFRKVFGGQRDLPHKNKSRQAREMTRDSLTVGQRAYLAERYAEDFERFGYVP